MFLAPSRDFPSPPLSRLNGKWGMGWVGGSILHPYPNLLTSLFDRVYLISSLISTFVNSFKIYNI